MYNFKKKIVFYPSVTMSEKLRHRDWFTGDPSCYEQSAPFRIAK